jgi:hypothetical protein
MDVACIEKCNDFGFKWNYNAKTWVQMPKFNRPATPMYPDSPIWTPIDDNEQQEEDGRDWFLVAEQNKRQDDKMRALEEELLLKMEVDMRDMEERMKEHCEKRMAELLPSFRKASTIMSSIGVIVNDPNSGKRTFKRRSFKRRFSSHYTGK